MEKDATLPTDQWQDLDISCDVAKDKPGRFINREMSWLEFNRRVYEEAMNASHPLLERLRFLSISASNLDEFYMVRVAGLKGQVASRVRGLNPDKLTPAQQLRAISTKVSELAADQHACFKLLMESLSKEGIELVGPDDLSADDRRWLSTMFRQNIFPILSPIAVDPAHPFPFIPNLGFGLVLELEGEEDVENLVALVIMPAQLDRFIRLPGKSIRFIALEKVVLIFLDLLFPSFTLLSSGTFRVIRDSEMEIDEEAEDLVRTFESALKRRRRGSVVRLTVDDAISSDLLYFIQAQLDVSKHDVFCFKGMIGLSDIRELVVDDRPGLLFPAYEARFPERIRDYGGDCLAAIPQYVQILTGSDFMEEIAWKFVLWYYDQLDLIYVPSQSTRDELVAKGISSEKIRVYPRGIDTQRFNPARRNGFFKKWNCDEKSTKLLYVGRVSKEKNLHLLSQAYRRLVESTSWVMLTVVGDGPYLDEMMTEIGDLPCNSPVGWKVVT